MFSFYFIHSTIDPSMKRKILAPLAMLVLIITGTLTPVFGLMLNARQSYVAQAVTPADLPPTQDTYGPENNPNPSPKSKEEIKAGLQAEPIDCGTNLLCSGFIWFTYFAGFLPNLLAQVSGIVLDFVVWKNLQSSTFTAQDTVDSFVVKGWKLTRDFSNLLFIFALFVVAFSLILSSAGTDNRPLFGLDPKRTIARVILMALLINFSFLMCRAIIDVTNTFGNVFYNKITVTGDTSGNQSQSELSSGEGGGDFGDSSKFYTSFTGVKSVSLGILNQINPQELLLKNGLKATNRSTDKISVAFGYKSYDSSIYITLLFVSAMVAIFNFFLIYLFVSSSIFLFSRIFGLFFLIILSPIAFVSTTIPAFQKKEWFGFDDWFQQLVGLAFSMPIYMFFVWLGIFFLQMGDGIEGKDMSGYILVAVMILVKLISMGFVLIFGQKVAKDMSGKIGAMATGAVTGLVTGAATVAAAGMTGGASAALRAGGGLARNAAISTAKGVGGAVLGDEKVEQISKRLSSGVGSFNTASLRRLNNFNPMRDMSLTNKTVGQNGLQLFKNLGAATGDAARMSGSSFPDKLNKAIERGKKEGDGSMDIIRARAKRFKEIREDKDKRMKLIDKDIEAEKDKFNKGKQAAADKELLDRKVKELEAKKKAINDGTDGAPKPPAPENPPANPNPATNPSPANPNPSTPAPQPAENPAPETKPAGIVDQSGTPVNSQNVNANGAGGPVRPPAEKPPTPDTGISSGTTTAPDTSILNRPDTPERQLSDDQKKSILTEIEQDLKNIEKDLNNPQAKLDKKKFDELETQYNELEQDRKDVREGRIPQVRRERFDKAYRDTAAPANVLTRDTQSPAEPYPMTREDDTIDFSGSIDNGGQRDFGGMGPRPDNDTPSVTTVTPTPPKPADQTSSLLTGITGMQNQSDGLRSGTIDISDTIENAGERDFGGMGPKN